MGAPGTEVILQSIYFNIFRYFLYSLQEHIYDINPLNAELNLICHLLALLGAHHILHVSGIRVKAGGVGLTA
jgi:hypothetical protein